MHTQVSFDRLVVNGKMIYCDLDRYDAGKVSLFVSVSFCACRISHYLSLFCRVLYRFIGFFSCVYRSFVLGLFVRVNIVTTSVSFIGFSIDTLVSLMYWM